MPELMDIVRAYEAGKRLYEELEEKIRADISVPDFRIIESYGSSRDSGKQLEHDDPEEKTRQDVSGNRIGCGDNLDYMMYLIRHRGMAGRLQLIYVDPPFFTKGQYASAVRLETAELGKSPLIKLGAYNDRWEQGMEEYLAMLTVRLFLMRELLADTGCIWLHLDWHAVHYVKLLMDQIFGEKNFINEVIWTYKSGGANKRSFAKKHDTLLLYGKSKKYYFDPLKEKSYNRGFKPYRFKGVKEYRDETGWYTMVNMKDVWSIDMVGRTSGERTGYATQKPEKLLERIVASCSREGDICADFFAGSGTLGAVCERMGRKWILCDDGALSIAAQAERMGAADASFAVEVCDNDADGSGSGFNAETPRGRLDFTVVDGKIELLGYDTNMLCAQEESRGELLKYMRNDSLCMVRCWSIDPDHDGLVHRGIKVMDGSQRLCFLPLKEGSRISIAGYDVMGGRFFETIVI